MASRRFKLVEVPCEGPPQNDELTLDFGLLDSQLAYLEPKSQTQTDAEGEICEGLVGLIDGLKDVASTLGVPDAELYPRSCNHD